MQESSRKWDTNSLLPETKMVDISKLIRLDNLLVRKVTWFVLPTMSSPLILSSKFGADHMTRISHIYSRLTITHSFSHFDFQRQHSLSYILTSRDSLSLPASDTQLNTCNMGAYILCNLFLSCSAFSAGRVPVLYTASDISSNPERDKRPTWEKTHHP